MQCFSQLIQIDDITVFFHHIIHIDRNHYRNSQLQKLCCQIHVSLKIGPVNDIQNNIRLFLHQIVSGHLFFWRIRGQGINTWQILDDYIMMTFEEPILFFNRYTSPVPYVLRTSGEFVEQCGFSTIWITRQGNFY